MPVIDERATQFLALAWAAAKGVLATAIIGILLINVGRDLLYSTYAIDGVVKVEGKPATGAAAGSGSGQEISKILRDEMGWLTKRGYIGDFRYVDPTLQAESVESDQPKFKFQDTEFSLNFITILIRRAFGRQIKHISGDLQEVGSSDACKIAFPPGRFSDPQPTERPSIYRLTLRASDDPFGFFFKDVGCLDTIIARGAVATLTQIDPITAAGAESTLSAPGSREAALRLIEETIAIQRRDNESGWSAIFPVLRTSLHRALLVRGLIEERMERFSDAASDFEQADAAYVARPLALGHHWHIAKDSLAYAEINLAGRAPDKLAAAKHLDNAGDAVRQSLLAMPDYDSALYHDAMVHDHRARRAFQEATAASSDAGSDLCSAYDEAAKARQGYRRLFAAYPSFDIAHLDQAQMTLAQMTFLQSRHKSGCGTNPKNDLPSRVKDLDEEVEHELQSMLLAEPGNMEAQKQLVHLLIQRQELTYVHPPSVKLDDPSRTEVLQKAKAQLTAVVASSGEDDDTRNLRKIIDNQMEAIGSNRNNPTPSP